VDPNHPHGATDPDHRTTLEPEGLLVTVCYTDSFDDTSDS
jgi:hypothetical protein